MTYMDVHTFSWHFHQRLFSVFIVHSGSTTLYYCSTYAWITGKRGGGLHTWKQHSVEKFVYVTNYLDLHTCFSWLLIFTWSGLPLRGSESSTSSVTGLSLITESCCRWLTSTCLNSSSVFVSRSFCLKEMPENIVANVLPTSMAVLVLF